MDKHREEILVEEVKNGNNEAFEKLIKKYEITIRNKIRVKVMKEEKIDEIYNETLIQIYTSIEKYDSQKGGFYNYVWKAADLMVKRYFSSRKDEQLVEEALHELGKYKLGGRIKEEEGKKELEKKDQETVNRRFKALLETCKSGEVVSTSAEEKYINENISTDRIIYEYCFDELKKLKNSHKTIVFLLNKVVYSSKYENKSGNPKEIVERFSDKKLYDILSDLKDEYKRISDLPSDVIEKRFEPLEKKLNEEENGIKLGDKLLKEYYNKNPEKDISEWSYRVGEKLKKKLGEKFLRKIYEN